MSEGETISLIVLLLEKFWCTHYYCYNFLSLEWSEFHDIGVNVDGPPLLQDYLSYKSIGLLMESEAQMLNSVQSPHPKYWIPCVWYINLLRKADTEKKISNAPGMKTLLDVSYFHWPS